MRPSLVVTAVTIGALVLIPGGVSAAPPGQGLQDPIPVECEGLGSIMVTETRGGAPTAWGNGTHVVVQSLTVTAPDGTVVFSARWGNKTGLTTFTCEAVFEENGLVLRAVAQVAVIPPS